LNGFGNLCFSQSFQLLLRIVVCVFDGEGEFYFLSFSFDFVHVFDSSFYRSLLYRSWRLSNDLSPCFVQLSFWSFDALDCCFNFLDVLLEGLDLLGYKGQGFLDGQVEQFCDLVFDVEAASRRTLFAEFGLYLNENAYDTCVGFCNICLGWHFVPLFFVVLSVEGW